MPDNTPLISDPTRWVRFASRISLGSLWDAQDKARDSARLNDVYRILAADVIEAWSFAEAITQESVTRLLGAPDFRLVEPTINKLIAPPEEATDTPPLVSDSSISSTAETTADPASQS